MRAKPLRICDLRLAQWRENTAARLSKAWGDARGKAEPAWDDADDSCRTFSGGRRAVYVRENPTNGGFETALWNRVCPVGLIFRVNRVALNG